MQEEEKGGDLGRITTASLAAHYRSKKEIFNCKSTCFLTHSIPVVLTVDAGYYLPKYTTINAYFMKDIMARRK